MKLVSNNSESDIARHCAEGQLANSLQTLAANMLRVIRGAGRAYEIQRQLLDVLEAMDAYREATGRPPPAELVAGALDIEEPDWVERLEELEWRRYDAEQQIIRGALQVVASEMLGQRTQATAGKHELSGGVNELVRVREERRRELSRPFNQRAVTKRKAPKPSTRRSGGEEL